jgi:hypothetical protein
VKYSDDRDTSWSNNWSDRKDALVVAVTPCLETGYLEVVSHHRGIICTSPSAAGYGGAVGMFRIASRGVRYRYSGARKQQ